MKKLLTFFTLLLLAASCTKEVDISQGEMSGEAVTFTASMVDMTSTKATLKNSWSDDEVALFAGDVLYRYTIAADGTMSGDDIIVDREEVFIYTVFYPYDSSFSTIEEYESACKQGNVDYMSASTTTSGKTVNLQFSHTMAALSFSIMVESTITDIAISLSVDGSLNNVVALEETASIGSVASIFKANYFVADGTDISSAFLKVEQSGIATIHAISREDSNTLEAGKQYPFSCTIGDLPTGSGVEGDPYVVYTADDMRKVGTGTDGWSMSSHYILAWDIDLGEKEFTPIGYRNSSTDQSRFTGTFDGDGHEISGLYINQPTINRQALFGSVYGATIKNLGVSGSITGNMYVGGVVGFNDSSSISDCYYSGSVVGSSEFVGGVVGYNYSSMVSDCYNKG